MECALLAALIVTVQFVGMTVLGPEGGSNIFHPLAGIGIGWFLARGIAAWPGLLIGAGIADALILLQDGVPLETLDARSLLVSGSLGLADLFNALVVYGLVRRFLHCPVTLLRPRERLKSRRRTQKSGFHLRAERKCSRHSIGRNDQKARLVPVLGSDSRS